MLNIAFLRVVLGKLLKLQKNVYNYRDKTEKLPCVCIYEKRLSILLIPLVTLGQHFDLEWLAALEASLLASVASLVLFHQWTHLVIFTLINIVGTLFLSCLAW